MSQTEHKKKRLHWTPEERELLALRMAEILVVDDTISRHRLWVKCQDVLDANRRRKKFVTTGKDLHLFETGRKLAAQRKHTAKAATPPPKVEPEVQYIPVPVEMPLNKVPLNQLLAELIGRLLVSYMPQLSPQPPQAQVPQVQIPPHVRVAFPQAPVVEPREEKPPRVAVVGLLKDQFNHLKDRINQKKVELVWIDKDRSSTDFPPSLDFVVVQRHSSHAQWNGARGAFGDRAVFVDGGITACQEAITQEYGNCLN